MEARDTQTESDRAGCPVVMYSGPAHSILVCPAKLKRAVLDRALMPACLSAHMPACIFAGMDSFVSIHP